MVQDSRPASYPGSAIASSYDFGSTDFSPSAQQHFAVAAALAGPLALQSEPERQWQWSGSLSLRVLPYHRDSAAYSGNGK